MQEPGLRRERQFFHLVQEQRSAIRQHQLTRSLIIAKKLTLHHILRNGCAVHHQKWLFPAATALMQVVCHGTLPGATLSLDQHWYIRQGHSCNLLNKRLKGFVI